jgi:hypothetical protein
MAFFCILSTFWIGSIASRRIGPETQQRGTADHHHNIVSGCRPDALSVRSLDEPSDRANAHDDKLRNPRPCCAG